MDPERIISRIKSIDEQPRSRDLLNARVGRLDLKNLPQNPLIARPATRTSLAETYRGCLAIPPVILMLAQAAAKALGIEQPMNRILSVAERYFALDDDVIPDRRGVLGLLDDCYFAMKMVERASDIVRAQRQMSLVDYDCRSYIDFISLILTDTEKKTLDELAEDMVKKSNLEQSARDIALQIRQPISLRQQWHRDEPGPMVTAARQMAINAGINPF